MHIDSDMKYKTDSLAWAERMEQDTTQFLFCHGLTTGPIRISSYETIYRSCPVRPGIS